MNSEAGVVPASRPASFVSFSPCRASMREDRGDEPDDVQQGEAIGTLPYGVTSRKKEKRRENGE